MKQTNEKLNRYSVSLTVADGQDDADILACKIDTLRCDVEAETFVNACIYAQAYFTEKLGIEMTVESGFCYGPYDEKCTETVVETVIEETIE